MATAKVQQIDSSHRTPQLEKARTGITGFDEVTRGGLPKGRPSIVCGGPGCGKTMFAVECLVRGAAQFGEPGVLMTFEEPGDEMAKNVKSGAVPQNNGARPWKRKLPLCVLVLTMRKRVHEVLSSKTRNVNARFPKMPWIWQIAAGAHRPKNAAGAMPVEREL